MINVDPFETETAPAVQAPAPAVQAVTTAPLSHSAAHLLKPPSEWTWSELRDYVIRSIEEVHGPQVRHAAKEKAVFKSFLERWGPDGVVIAQTAVTAYGCWWTGAPLSVNRFCKASDGFFAQKILDQLK